MPPTQLVVNECYFFALFFDDEFKYPSFESMVFLGINAFSEPESPDEDEYCFQDAYSFSAKGNLFGSETQDIQPDFRVVRDLNFVYDRAGLSKWLLEQHSPYIRQR